MNQGGTPRQGFGKRGRVDLPSRSGQPPQSTPPPVPEPDNGGLGFPKWAIGAVAAMFLFAMIAGSGSGGGGLLGGLIGGLIAGKMLAGNKPAPTTTPQTARAGGTTTAAASTTAPRTDVNRGGFGSTAAKTTSSSGFGFSFGG